MAPVPVRKLAARNRSDEQAQAILAEADAMIAAGDDLALITRHDIRFHQAVARASGNKLFVQIIRSFEPLMRIAVPAAWHTRVTDAQRRNVLEQHRRIAETIHARDAESTRAGMRAHFERSIGDILSSKSE